MYWNVYSITNIFRDIYYRKLPYNCRYCELLGICRRKRKDNWKCYKGCILLRDDWREEDD